MSSQEKMTIDQMVADFVWNVGSRKECDFVLFVQDCYTQDERIEVLDGLIACRCCVRHQQHMARSEPVLEKGCKCNCRHYARVFKRQNLA